MLTLTRGAKAAMTVALRSPERVSGLIPVDNAPVNAALKSDFPKYVRGMQHVEKAKVSKQSDANKILEKYEEVRRIHVGNCEDNPFC
jgi:pimeloyl-ACP methyl ester carboxylesterase